MAMEVDPRSRTTTPCTAMLSESKFQNSPEPMILGNFVSLIASSRDSSSYKENRNEMIINEASIPTSPIISQVILAGWRQVSVAIAVV